MKGFSKEFNSFIKRFSFIVPLIAVAAIGFGFQITNFSIGIDTLARDRYLTEGYSFAMGRFVTPLLAPILHLESIFPFAEELLSLLLLIIAAISICVVLKRASGDKLNFKAYTLFACLFISYPIINEIWVYSMMNWGIALGYMLIAFALIFTLEWFTVKKISNLISASLLVAIVTSLYESLLCVYICLVFVVLILQFIFGSADAMEFKTFARRGIVYLGVLIAGIALKLLTARVFMSILPELPGESVANNEILYGTLGLINGLRQVVSGIVLKYMLSAFWYLPITILVIAVVISLIFALVICIKRKKWGILLLFCGAQFSLIALSFIQGTVSYYRNCQVFAPFVAFVFMLLLHFSLNSSKKPLKVAVSSLMIWLCLIQSVELNNWFALNHMRYEQEKTVIETIACDLSQSYDIAQKPVVFIGKRKETSAIINKYLLIGDDSFARQFSFLKNVDKTLERNESNVNNVLGWGITAFDEPNTEIIKVFTYLGYDLKQGTAEMYNDALSYMSIMPAYPKAGYIMDLDNYIIVKLSDNKSPRLEVSNNNP